jgi:phosphoribosylformylglycinamidine synthase
MSAYEIMLSESQERMLVVIEKGKEEIAKQIFEEWDLNCVQIGHVTNDKNVKVYSNGHLAADVPANSLVLGGEAPVYIREAKEPDYLRYVQSFDFSTLPEPADLNQVLLKLLSSPNIANKNWVYEQYDTQVRTNTILLPGGDASVVRIKGTNKALAMKTDCNGRYAYLNPYKGAMIAVCESARNVACTGAVPLAITNCLNFGNPYKPEVYYQFKEAVRGIGDACKILNTPVTGGNVSFYNESPDYAVYPTPTIGMVGLIEDVSKMMTSYFKNEDDVIAVIGTMSEKTFDGVGGSEYLKVIHNLVTGDAPDIFPEREKNLINVLLEIINKKYISSAHDVSEGGIAVAIAESCIMNKLNPLGCKIGLNLNSRKDYTLFGENQNMIVISLNNKLEENVREICRKNSILYAAIGITGGETININNDINIALSDASEFYYNSISKIMED